MAESQIEKEILTREGAKNPGQSLKYVLIFLTVLLRLAKVMMVMPKPLVVEVIQKTRIISICLGF
jgi:hypothetical protein